MNLVDEKEPILHRPSQPVSDNQLKDNSIKPIASLLIHAIDHYQALGISACQLGINQAIFATNVNGQLKICINPQIVAASADMSSDFEGCLSFPNLILKVNRPSSVVVRYHNIDGNEITEHLDDLSARVWLHEYDHTQGICFTDRVSRLSLHMARKKLKKLNKRIKK